MAWTDMFGGGGGGGGGDWWSAMSGAISPMLSGMGNAASSAWNWAKPGLSSAMDASAPYLKDPRLWMGAAGTGLALGSNISNWQQQAAINDKIQRMIKNQPQRPDPSSYYTPMTEAARQAYTRQMGADMVTAGAPPDSAYLRNATAEGLAKTENQRWLDAARLASGDYGTALQGWGTGIQGLSGLRPSMPMGDMSSLGNAYSWIQQSRERQQKEQADRAGQSRWMDILSKWGPGQGSGTADTHALGMPQTGDMGMKQLSPYDSNVTGDNFFT